MWLLQLHRYIASCEPSAHAEEKEGSFSDELKQTARLERRLSSAVPALQAGETETNPQNCHGKCQVWWCVHTVLALLSWSQVDPGTHWEAILACFLSSKSVRDPVSNKQVI